MAQAELDRPSGRTAATGQGRPTSTRQGGPRGVGPSRTSRWPPAATNQGAWARRWSGPPVKPNASPQPALRTRLGRRRPLPEPAGGDAGPVAATLSATYEAEGQLGGRSWLAGGEQPPTRRMAGGGHAAELEGRHADHRPPWRPVSTGRMRSRSGWRLPCSAGAWRIGIDDGQGGEQPGDDRQGDGGPGPEADQAPHRPSDPRLCPTSPRPGKTNREINRCLIRHVARQLYRLLETQPAVDPT